MEVKEGNAGAPAAAEVPILVENDNPAPPVLDVLQALEADAQVLTLACFYHVIKL
jgi:hypothetical protein